MDAQLVHPFPCAKYNVFPSNICIDFFTDCSHKFMVHALNGSNMAAKMASVRNVTSYNTTNVRMHTMHAFA